MAKTKAKKEYERIETFYEGESGAPWVAYLKSKEVDGWQLESAMVVKEIDKTHFRGKVAFRREVRAELPLLAIKRAECNCESVTERHHGDCASNDPR